MPTFPHLWRKAGLRGGRVCLRGTGIGAEFVVSRFAAGETMRELAADYDVSEMAIRDAIRFVLYVQGTSLASARAEAKIERVIPLDGENT